MRPRSGALYMYRTDLFFFFSFFPLGGKASGRSPPAEGDGVGVLALCNARARAPRSQKQKPRLASAGPSA
jgi:hypothetical protein